MKEVSKLQGMLGKILAWNKARLDCFSQALIALFITRTVNLSELAVAIPLFWCLLNKAGNATAKEHRAIKVRIDIGWQIRKNILNHKAFPTFS